MQITSKSAWGSRATKVPSNYGKLPRVYIHHTAGHYPNSVEEEIEQMHVLQHVAVDIKGHFDIEYNWLIGPSGIIYEARGLSTLSAATLDQNSISRTICLIGNYQNNEVTPEAFTATCDLIKYLIKMNNLAEARQLEILGHKDNPDHPNATICPGANLYKLMGSIRNNVIHYQKPTGDEMLQERLIRQKGYNNVFIVGGGYPLFSISGELMAAIEAEQPDIPKLFQDNMSSFHGMCKIAGLDINDPKQVEPGGSLDHF